MAPACPAMRISTKPTTLAAKTVTLLQPGRRYDRHPTFTLHSKHGASFFGVVVTAASPRKHLSLAILQMPYFRCHMLPFTISLYSAQNRKSSRFLPSPSQKNTTPQKNELSTPGTHRRIFQAVSFPLARDLRQFPGIKGFLRSTFDTVPSCPFPVRLR